MATNVISSFGMPPGKPEDVPEEQVSAATDTKSKSKRKLSDAEIVSQIERYRNEAFMREYVIRNTWLDAYSQYRNKQDFDDKAPWQSRITFAKAHSAVKNFVANIMRLLQQSEQWVSVEPGETSKLVNLQTLAPLVESTTLKLADNAHFRSQLRDALEFAGACGLGVLKVGWAYQNAFDLSVGSDDDGPLLVQKTRKEGQLHVQSIDPFHIWTGPRTKENNRFDFVIEESLVDVSQLKSQTGLENTAELDHVDHISDQMFFADQVFTRDFERTDKRMVPAEHYRKQALVWEFWGDLIDPHTQAVVDANVHILIANRSTVLKYEKNPYWDGLPPYVIFSPLVVAGRFPGQGILEMNLSVKDAIDRLAQMQEDHLKFSVVPMLEVEAGALENPEGDMQTGVQPGKVFYKRNGAGPGAVSGVQFPQLGNASFNFQMEMGKEYQRGTGVTDQAQGVTDAKGETTATEVQSVMQQSSLLLADVALTLDDNCLSFVAEKIWNRAFQFIDSTSKPTWSELAGPSGQVLDQLPVSVRIQLIQGRFNFKAHGLSRAVERQQNLSKYKDLLMTLAQLGPQALTAAGLNLTALLRRVFDGYHFPNPQELVSPQGEQMQEQQRQAAMVQQNPFLTEMAKAHGKIAATREQFDQQSLQKLLDSAMSMHQPQEPQGPVQ